MPDIDLQQSLSETVRAHLPEMVAKELLERLREGEAAIEENVGLGDEVENLRAKLQHHRDLEAVERSLDERKRRLDERQQELKEQRNELEIRRLQIELSAEQEKAKFARDVALGLVRNIEYRRAVFGNTPVPTDGNGGYVTTANHNEETTERAE